MNSLLCMLSVLSLAHAFFSGCGCRQCGCGAATYGGYGYQQSPYSSSYSSSYGYQQPSYQSSYSSFSPYPPGPISGYILRPVGPVRSSGYAVAGYGGNGVPVVHSQYGQIGYIQSRQGSLPNGPYYWQPAAGSPYERVIVAGLRF